MIDLVAVGLFALGAIALLGSPGPGIAALIGIGRTRGLAEGLRFYAGLQVGLALAAGASALGVLSLIKAVPHGEITLTWIAVAYLLYLAWSIASAPVGTEVAPRAWASSAMSGFVIGITNIKAYIAIASLMSAYSLAGGNAAVDLGTKWVITVLVIMLVDILWLLFGAVLGRVRMTAPAERTLNVVLGLTVAGTAVMTVV